jgi:hypothetical protein
MPDRHYLSFLSLVLLSTLLISGCVHEETGKSLTEDSEPPPPQDLGETLELLGIDTSETLRLDDRGEPYPDSYSPLGTYLSMREISVADAMATDPQTDFVIGRAEELLLSGFRTAEGLGVISIADDFSIADTDPANDRLVRPDILFQQDQVEAPWVFEQRDLTVPAWVVPGTRRAATAADVNGNGFKETALAYVYDYGNGRTGVRLRVTDGLPVAPTTSDVAIPIDLRYFPVFDLRIKGGDFDGDGIDELALAVASKPIAGLNETLVGIYIIEGESDGFSIAQEYHVPFVAALPESYVTLVLEDARLDHDNISELVLVLNENAPNSGPPGSFASQYLVLSVSDAGLVLVSNGQPRAMLTADDQSLQEHIAVVADVAAGDFDGDSVDELVFGGLEDVINNCEEPPDPDIGETGLRHLVVVMGNSFNDYSQVGGLSYRSTPNGCDQAQGFGLRFTHVNTLDFDGDGDTDIHINDRVYEGPVDEVFESVPISIITRNSLITADGSGAYYDRSNSIITVSDQTGDGIADLIALLISFDQDPNIHVYSWDPESIDAQSPFEMPLWAEDIQNTDLINPIIVPVDVDNDNVSILQYTGEHNLDFTEPVVLAVLAAAPCIRGIGQNIGDSCSTSWGSAQTGAAGRSFSVSVYGSVGAGIGGAGAGASVKSLVKLNAEVSRVTSESYELSKSRTFSTGPFEDGVIFTSVPMDRYTYERIVARLPEDGFLGERLKVNLPRSPDMRIVTREYYNASLAPNPDNPPLTIGDNIFQHTPGDLSSYPTKQEKDLILLRAQSIVNEQRIRQASESIDSLFPYLPSYMGLEVGPVAVGEGGGSSELGLEYSEIFGRENAFEVGFEFEAETLTGAAYSFSAGMSAGRNLQISHGDTTLYGGSVGSIPSEFYADNQYQFGLFSYLMAEDNQEFEVVNYWVER